jgi:hypothetical protein
MDDSGDNLGGLAGTIGRMRVAIAQTGKRPKKAGRPT